MRLSSKGEYACLALVYLAQNESAGPISTQEIASANGIPKKFLEQILLTLKHNGYVRSRKGPDGGYSLAKPAAGISLAEIIRLMDGALAPVGSVSEYFPSPSPAQRSVALTAVFREIRNYLAEKLESTSFDDLARREVAGRDR